MIRIFIIVFSFLGFNISTTAQDSVEEMLLLDFFEKPQKVQWIKHYKGRIDDLNDIAISLAFDGKNCKGQLLYLRSKEVFDLVGIVKKNKITLQEFDEDHEISGHLKGEMLPEGLKLEWANFNNTIGGNLLLKEIEKPLNVPTYCGDNKWIRRYKGLIGREKLELILHKESSRAVNGTAYFKTDNQTYQVRGYMDAFDNLNLTVRDNFDRVKGKFEGTFDEKQKLNANFSHQNGQFNTCSFHVKDFLAVGCIEYADYTTAYDVLYPKTQNANFNHWIESLVEEWIKSCKLYAIDVKKMNPEITPAMRASIRANTWCAVDYFSDDLISGVLTFSNTWSSKQESRNINFDLVRGVEITIEDIFKHDVDYRTLVRNYLNKKISKHNLYKDKDFRKWLAEADFPIFTIRKEGINFSTKFNSIYGQQEITVPYAELKSYLKKKSIISKLID